MRTRWAMAVAAALAGAGCATPAAQPYPARPAGEYALSVTQDGVTVGIEPLTEPERCERHFTTDLASSDILPVFVAVENRSSASLLLLRYRVEIAVVGSSLTPPPLLVYSMRAVTSHRSMVLHQLEAAELLDVTLSPGEVVSGFRYFDLRKLPGGPQQLTLSVELTDLATRATRTLEVAFPWQRRARS